MSAQKQPAGASLTREQILAALQAFSDELGKNEVLELVGKYYPANRIPVKTQSKVVSMG